MLEQEKRKIEKKKEGENEKVGVGERGKGLEQEKRNIE